MSVPAKERPTSDGQRRWIVALAEHHGVDPATIPPLNASQAGALLVRWSRTLPPEVRKGLGDQ